MKTTTQSHRPSQRSARIEELADLLLDEIDDDVDGVDDGLLRDVGLHGRGGFGDFGGDDAAHLWR